MNSKWLYNPFERIAGWEAAGIGLAVFLLTGYFSYLSGAHFYGYLNTDFAKNAPYWVYLAEHGLHVGVIMILTLISGWALSKSSVRFIDVVGTALFARIPLVLVPVVRLLPALDVSAVPSVALYIHIGVFLLASIWSIIMTYHAFRISCNLKKERLVASFTTTLIVAELITKIFIPILIK